MKRWIPIAFVAIAILALGAAIVPTGFEQAFMALRDQEFTKATDSFERRWKNGDRSREVANALAELYVRQGSPGRAAEILVTYLRRQPDDQAALSRLAEIFRDDQQREKYISTLETLWKQNKNIEVLRNLEKLYELAGREDKQLQALQKLVRSSQANVSDFVSLAALLSARDTTKALETLYNAFLRWPKGISTDTAQTFVVLAADLDRLDLIRAQILPWTKLQIMHSKLEPVIVSLVAKRLDALALEAVLSSGALAQSDPATAVLAARLEAQALQFDKTFTRLETLRVAGKLPRRGDDVYIEAAITTKKRDLALAHILERGPDNLPFWLQTWIVTKAAAEGDRDLLLSLKNHFSEVKTAGQSFLIARVELALGAKDAATALALRAEKHVADVSGAIAIAGLHADLKDFQRARAILHKFAPDPAHVPLDDLPQAITVALTIRESANALAMAQTLQEARPGTTADILFARALGQAGKTTQAIELLEEIDIWSDAKEFALIEILKSAGRNKQLHQLLVDRLTHEPTTMAQRTNYTFVLNESRALEVPLIGDAADIIADDLDSEELQGPPRLARIELLSKANPNRALPYAKEAAEAAPETAAYVYLQLLKRLNLKSEAIAFFTSIIDGIESEKTRQQMLHDWIALGITPQALPYLKVLAEAGDRQWFFAYDDALKKLSRREERLRFLTAYAGRPGLDSTFRSQLASELLEAGAKERALTLFLEDAGNASAKSKEVEQLLFLWGPRPDATAIKWLCQRTASARASERNAWLDRLSQAGAPEKIVEFAANWYEAGDHTILGNLAEAYATLKQPEQLKGLLAAEAARDRSNPEDLARLALAAEGLGLTRQAAEFYRRAAAHIPKYLAAAGRTAWYAGDRSGALLLLEQANTSKSEDPDLVFILAEAHRAAKNKTEALRFYELAAELGRKNSNVKYRQVELIALARMGKFSEAEYLLTLPLYQSHRADYANALLDDGNVARVQGLLTKTEPLTRR